MYEDRLSVSILLVSVYSNKAIWRQGRIGRALESRLLPYLYRRKSICNGKTRPHPYIIHIGCSAAKVSQRAVLTAAYDLRVTVAFDLTRDMLATRAPPNLKPKRGCGPRERQEGSKTPGCGGSARRQSAKNPRTGKSPGPGFASANSTKEFDLHLPPPETSAPAWVSKGVAN